MSTTSTEQDRLADFVCEPFSARNITKDVYRAGSGPAVVVLTEMPGITPEVADFARRLIAEGFSVTLPDLFGEAGRPFSNGYVIRSLVKGCVSKEFVAFARNTTSPITSWLRELVADAHRRAGGDAVSNGVGVVGMCFTGGFALALTVDPLVRVPVMSQPSLPLGPGAERRRDLGLDPEDLAVVKRRVEDEDLCVVGLRFTGDPMVSTARFERLREEFGDRFAAVEIRSGKEAPDGHGPRAHSVLTTEYDPTPGSPTRLAYELVVEHLGRLRPPT